MATILTFEAYDDNKAGELSVTINGVLGASLPKVDTPENSGIWAYWTLYITNIIKEGTNTLLFNNTLAPTSSSTIRNIAVTHEGQILVNEPNEHLITGSSEPVCLLYTSPSPRDRS